MRCRQVWAGAASCLVSGERQAITRQARARYREISQDRQRTQCSVEINTTQYNTSYLYLSI